MEDITILDLYLQRREDAIIYTEEKYGDRLRRIALGMLQDTQAAEECENDTYLDAWNRIPPHKPYTYLFSFLSCALRRIAIDFCRQRSALKRSGMVVELTEEMAQ